MPVEPRGDESRVLAFAPDVRQRGVHHALAEFPARHLAVVVSRERGGVEAVIVLRDELFREGGGGAVEIATLVSPTGSARSALEGVVVEVARRVHAGAETRTGTGVIGAGTGDVVARHFFARRASAAAVSAEHALV